MAEASGASDSATMVNAGKTMDCDGIGSVRILRIGQVHVIERRLGDPKVFAGFRDADDLDKVAGSILEMEVLADRFALGPVVIGEVFVDNRHARRVREIARQETAASQEADAHGFKEAVADVGVECSDGLLAARQLIAFGNELHRVASDHRDDGGEGGGLHAWSGARAIQKFFEEAPALIVGIVNQFGIEAGEEQMISAKTGPLRQLAGEASHQDGGDDQQNQ